MAVPTVITDLNVTAASNSPAGADSVASNTGPDEYFRALSAIIKREQSQGTATASAATIDLGAIATGSYLHITGTTGPITSFGTVAAGVERTLVFDSTPTITHHATSMILLGGANRSLAAGDICVFRSEGSGNWREVAYHPATGGGIISVARFGAVGNGTADDTAAIQAALTAAKGADATGVGRSVFSLYFPNVPGGFYKVTDTLVIDGTHGIHIFGDGALKQREVTAPEGVIRWYGASSKPVFQIKGGTGTPSNPNFLIKISDLTISGYASIITQASVPAALALSGIHIGNLNGANEATQARNVVIDNVNITDCRFGIWSGTPDAMNTDHASVNITNCYITRNAQAGIHWGTGNAVGSVHCCHITNNGWGSASFLADDYMPQLGANVYVASGYLDLLSLTTAGTGTSQPITADIYQASGRVSIINAWSDTDGYFFYQDNATASNGAYQVGQITGVRHYASTMTVGNTPTSMYLKAPGTVVSACTVYGNIQIVSGLGGRPVFSGINFIRTGATFTGTGLDTQRSLLHVGHGSGNYAQIAMGGRDSGVSLAQVGALQTPQFLSMGASVTGAVSILQALGGASTDSGATVTIDPATGSVNVFVNCYVYDAAFNLRAHKAGKAYRMVIGGDDADALRLYVTEFANTTTSILYTAFTNIGGVKVGGSTGTYSQAVISFPQAASAPTFTSGDWWKGGVYYNTTTNKLQVNTGASTWVDLY